MPQLTLVRHGQSTWNQEERFTGWTDVDLTSIGIEQVRFAARQFLDAGLEFDVCFCSVLKRCIRSSWILLEMLDQMWVPLVLDWRLNERHYGALTGQIKADVIKEFGSEQVWRWRRSYEARPPAMESTRLTQALIDGRYANIPTSIIPIGESLADTAKRIRLVWADSIAKALQNNQRVVLMGHGNCLRALIQMLEGIPDRDITKTEIPNASAVTYSLDSHLKVIAKHQFKHMDQKSSEIL